MAARPSILIALLALATSAGACREVPPGSNDATGPAQRIVSVVPAMTEILLALGAGPQLAGISSYDELPPGTPDVPRVGALLNPDTERILSLRPDLVVVYGSQGDLEARLQRAGISTYSYRHGGVREVLAAIHDLADRAGHRPAGERLVEVIEADLAAIEARVEGLRRPRTLLVFEREPGSLRGIYASGGRGFLHEMLLAAGGENVFGDIDRESVQPSVETLLTRAPEVIIEIRASDRGDSPIEAWARLSALPAVQTGRVHTLTGSHLVVAGSRIAEATEAIARALHPAAFR